MKTNLVEATKAAPEIKGSRWRSLLISEGKGSSGYYSADLLKEFGTKAFPKGTHVYFDHLGESEAEERRGSHSVRDLVGVIDDDPEFNEADNGLYGNIKFFEKHKALMEEIAPHVGLSIEAGGELDEDQNVTAFYESPLNAVSVVPRAGRGGKLVELVESFRESSDRIDNDAKPGTDAPGTNSERNLMTEQEIKDLAEALAAAIKPEFTALTEALAPKAPEEPKDEKDVDEAAVVESAVEAGLSKASRVRVVEAVRAGTTPDDAIKAEKDLREQILAEAATEDEPVGRVRESASGGSDFTIGGW